LPNPHKNLCTNSVGFPASQFFMRGLTIALELLLLGLLSRTPLTLLTKAASIVSSHDLSIGNFWRGRLDRPPPLLLGIILFFGHLQSPLSKTRMLRAQAAQVAPVSHGPHASSR